MNEKPKKLILNRETVKRLGPESLKYVRGAVTGYACSQDCSQVCSYVCGPTWWDCPTDTCGASCVATACCI